MTTKFILNITKGRVLFFMILFFCLFPMNVMAKESYGTCVYKPDVKKLGLQNYFKEISLSVTVYDDGSTGDRKFSVVEGDHEWDLTPPKGGELIASTGIYLYYEGMFQKNGRFYDAYMERGNCPTMQFVFDGSMQLEFVLNGGRATNGFSDTLDNVQSTGGTSSVQPSQPQTFCNKSFSFNDGDDTISMKFITKQTGNVKEFTIEYGDDSDTVNYNGIASVGNYTFSVRQSDYDLYWSDSCSSANIYVKDLGVGTSLIIQSEDPEDEYADNWTELGQDLDDSNFGDSIDCPDIINMDEGKLGWLLNTILNYIRVIGPVLVVLLSAIDFIKAIVGTDEKAMKEAQSKLIIRLVAAIALFLIPTLVQLLLSFINATTCTLG